MVNTRNNQSNGQPNHTNTKNPINLKQLIATQNNLMQTILQTLNNMQSNQQHHQQQAPPPPPPHQSQLAEFLQTHPTTFSQAKDPMEAEDWLKGIEKKLVITQCMDHEKVLFVAHQLFGTAVNWWETYCNTHTDVNSITWNEFQTHFHTHYVPHSIMKLKKEFTDLK
jgi:PKD repeat protein